MQSLVNKGRHTIRFIRSHSKIEVIRGEDYSNNASRLISFKFIRVLILIVVFLIILLILKSLRLLFKVGNLAVFLFIACFSIVLIGTDLI